MSLPPPPPVVIPAQVPIPGEDFVKRDEIQHLTAGTMDLAQKYADLTGQVSGLRSQVQDLQTQVAGLETEIDALAPSSASGQEQTVPHG